jgi:hypothetical protein
MHKKAGETENLGLAYARIIHIYVCMHVCIYIYIYIYIYIHIYIYTYRRGNHMYMCVYICIHTHTHTHTYTWSRYMCVCASTAECIRGHVHIYIHTYVYIYVYIYIYIYTSHRGIHAHNTYVYTRSPRHSFCGLIYSKETTCRSRDIHTYTKQGIHTTSTAICTWNPHDSTKVASSIPNSSRILRNTYGRKWLS